jgi:hypothetical protein
MIADNLLLNECKYRPVLKAEKRKKTPDGIPSRGGESFLIHISTRHSFSMTDLMDWLEVFQCLHWNNVFSNLRITFTSTGIYD